MYNRKELEKVLDEYGYLPKKNIGISRSIGMQELQFALLIKIAESLDKLVGNNITNNTKIDNWCD